MSPTPSGCGLRVFANVANSEGGRIAAMRIPGGASLRRGEIDRYTKFVGIWRRVWHIKVNDVTQVNETGLQSPIVKNLNGALRTVLSAPAPSPAT